MDNQRLKVLLYNAIVILEEQNCCELGLMDTDLADDIGITQEEYDEIMSNELRCPFGGDETDDCDGCAYSGDYHYVDGECKQRDDI